MYDNYQNYKALGEYDNEPTEEGQEGFDLAEYNKEINGVILEGIKV